MVRYFEHYIYKSAMSVMQLNYFIETNKNVVVKSTVITVKQKNKTSFTVNYRFQSRFLPSCHIPRELLSEVEIVPVDSVHLLGLFPGKIGSI